MTLGVSFKGGFMRNAKSKGKQTAWQKAFSRGFTGKDLALDKKKKKNKDKGKKKEKSYFGF